MEWKKPTEPPIELKPVLAWIRYYSMPAGEIMWHEEKKIKKYGYVLACIARGVWWDGRATINSRPIDAIDVIGWTELPTPPSA